MKIHGQYQWTDYLKAELLYMQPTGFSRIIQFSAFSFVALALISLLYLVFIGFPGISISYVLLLFILTTSFPFLSRYVFIPNRVKKTFAQQKELSLPIEFEFTETSMNTSNELGNNTRPWTYFIKWKENEEIIILYHTDLLLTIIPKRFFIDHQQITTVKSYLEKNKITKVKSGFGRKETG